MRRLIRIALVLALPLTATLHAQDGAWAASWAASPTASVAVNSASGKSDQTVRETVHLSLGGSALRVVLTNEFGTDPLTIGAATVALASATSTPAAITFGGQPSVTIAPGAFVTSDAITLRVPPLADITFNLFVPAQPMAVVTQHGSAFTSNYFLPGNQIAAPTADPGKETTSWRFLKGVQVMTAEGARAIVAFGDSITDGAKSTINANARWPDVLARRLAASNDKALTSVGVLDQGIGGNRILHDGTGPAAISRFDRDVLAQPNARYLIILEGINDITRATRSKNPDVVSVADLTAALRYIIERAHARGMKVYGATLTPYANCGCANPAGIAMHDAENAFIRSGAFDGVIDFEKATLDPAHPGQMLPAYDSGDHLHPNDAGYKAMGDSIDLSLFKK